MSAGDQRFQRLEQLFHEALELPADRRAAFLDDACGDDRDLREELERLLVRSDRTGVTRLVPLLGNETEAPPSAPFVPGGTIGPYRLLQRVGEGGMGEIWLAEQTEPIRRQVAIKVIKKGMDTRQVVVRFEAERQALAMMEHPNIARVFEAGETPDGRPYFVMEYVRGVPITEYCDRRRLTNKDRLSLFMQVCEGVQHAHHKAIIHRDLKPSNVLVTLEQDRAVPKIIDFGVAKATAQKLTTETMHTQLGVMIGTPAYMSPEQAELTGQDIDTRSDVYALGVMLYELLVGALPFDMRELGEAGLEAMVRKIREETPPRPSTRLTTLGEGSTTSAERRNTELPSLKRELVGDLDWITLKALEKDRTRRYGSPKDLAADIERFLTDQPVVAGPPSAAYRARKFVRRHRFGVIAASLLTLALLAGIAGTTVGLLRARRAEVAARQAETLARSEAEAAQRVTDFLVGLFKVSDPGEAVGNSITAREILDRGVAAIETELRNDPLVQARMMGTMGTVYRSLGLYDPSRSLLEGSVETLRREVGTDDPRTLEAENALAGLLILSGDTDEARAILGGLVPRSERVLGPADAETARAVNNLAALLLRTQRYEEALPLLRRSLAIREEVLGPNHSDVAKVLTNLGFVKRKLEDYRGAQRDLERAVAIRTEVLGPDHPDTAKPMINLGLVLSDLGDVDAARATLERALEIRMHALGPDHRGTIYVQEQLQLLAP